MQTIAPALVELTKRGDIVFVLVRFDDDGVYGARAGAHDADQRKQRQEREQKLTRKMHATLLSLTSRRGANQSHPPLAFPKHCPSVVSAGRYRGARKADDPARRR